MPLLGILAILLGTVISQNECVVVHVYWDQSLNGAQDAEEPGLESALVQLRNMDDDSIVALPSAGTGDATFTTVPAGFYIIMVTYNDKTVIYPNFPEIKAGSLCADNTFDVPLENCAQGIFTAPDTFRIQEEEPLVVEASKGLLANDFEVRGMLVSVVNFTQPDFGMLNVSDDGAFIYTPAPNQYGKVTFDYLVTDGEEFLYETATIWVESVNDPPVLTDDFYETTMGNPLDVVEGVLLNDTDADSIIFVTGNTQPAHGMVKFNSDGTFVYTPDVGYGGVDSFTYTVDDCGDQVTATVYVNVIDVPPVAADDSYELDQGETLTVRPEDGVLVNDTDPNDPNHKASVLTEPANGILTLDSDGGFSYTPDPSFCGGQDSFTYTVSDAGGNSDTATVSLDVTCNLPPIASPDGPYQLAQGDTLQVDAPSGVLANDADPDSELAELVASVTQPSNGVIVMNADGSFQYTPHLTFCETETTMYTVTDPFGNTDSAALSFTVDCNLAPVALPDGPYTVAQGALLTVPAQEGLRVNDADPDTDTQDLTTTVSVQPAHGTVPAMSPAGAFNYRPNFDFCGTDSFTYQVTDPFGNSDTALVELVVECNQPPVAGPDGPYYVNQGGALVVPVGTGLLANDKDVDSTNLAAEVYSPPSDGAQLELNKDGSFTYRPRRSFCGESTLEYAVVDEFGNLDTMEVVVVVACNQPPVASDDGPYLVGQGQVLDVPRLEGVLANDQDPDSTDLFATAFENPPQGTLALNTDGSLRYIPDRQFCGDDSVPYTLNDPFGNTDTATIFFIVACSDSPIASDDSYELGQDQTLVIPGPGVLANDADPEDDPLSATLNAGSSSGTVTYVNSDGGFEYVPAPGECGQTASFTYGVSDGFTESVATVSLTVVCPPTATPDTISFGNNGTVTLDPAEGVLANDEGSQLTAEATAGPYFGTLELAQDGGLTYTANEAFCREPLAYDKDDPNMGTNNGFGNGDQASPGNSGPNNNAENSGGDGSGTTKKNDGNDGNDGEGCFCSDNFTYTVTDRFGQTDSETVVISLECKPNPVSSEGCDIDFWKKKDYFSAWPDSLPPDTFVCDAFYMDQTECDTLSQLLGQQFTLAEVLNTKGASPMAFMRQATAALINCELAGQETGQVDYYMTRCGELRTWVRGAITGDTSLYPTNNPDQLQNLFSFWNNAGCPIKVSKKASASTEVTVGVTVAMCSAVLLGGLLGRKKLKTPEQRAAAKESVKKAGRRVSQILPGHRRGAGAAGASGTAAAAGTEMAPIPAPDPAPLDPAEFRTPPTNLSSLSTRGDVSTIHGSPRV